MTNYSGSYATPRLDLGEAFWEYNQANAGVSNIATSVLGTFNSSVKAGTFSKMRREGILRDDATTRAAKDTYSRGSHDAEDQAFACVEYGYEEVVDDSERNLYSSDFDAEMASLIIAAGKIERAQEIRTAAAVFNTTTWTGASLYTDRGSAPWSTISTDIVAHVVDAVEKVRSGSGERPDTLIVGAATFSKLLKNTGIRNQFPGASIITMEMLEQQMGAIFGLRKLLVGGAVKNTAIEGQDAVVADVWSGQYAMVAKTADAGSSLSTPCIGRSILWTGDSPTNLVVESYREEQSRGEVIRARQNVDELIIDPTFGHLIEVEA